MTRTRISLISATAIASILGAALPAFAQAPAPAYAPAPAVAPAPAPEGTAVMPAAPVLAPRASDDMTGSVGLGVGVSGAPATSLVSVDTANLMLKYWMSDALALVPRLAIGLSKTKGFDASWAFSPSILASFGLLKGASTRLSAGVGIGLSLSKNPNAVVTTNPDAAKTLVDIFIPVQLSVEHFFTRWFAMGIAIDERFLDFHKQGTPWTFGVGLDTLSYMGSLFFYTD
jgi:hypothetical protein